MLIGTRNSDVERGATSEMVAMVALVLVKRLDLGKEMVERMSKGCMYGVFWNTDDKLKEVLVYGVWKRVMTDFPCSTTSATSVPGTLTESGILPTWVISVKERTNLVGYVVRKCNEKEMGSEGPLIKSLVCLTGSSLRTGPCSSPVWVLSPLSSLAPRLLRGLPSILIINEGND